MNSVHLTGRLSKDPELRTTSNGKSVCRFQLAISRGRRNGEDLGADWPTCVIWDKSAENFVKFVKKGKMVAINGRIHTGKYDDKDGKTVYTTEVWADVHNGWELLSPRDSDSSGNDSHAEEIDSSQTDSQAGFIAVETDSLPF